MGLLLVAAGGVTRGGVCRRGLGFNGVSVTALNLYINVIRISMIVRCKLVQ